MTEEIKENQEQNKTNDKEYNFRALESRYQRQLEEERNARLEAERIAKEAINSRKSEVEEEDDDSSEPYVDHKRLSKKFSQFEKRMEEKIEKKAEEKARGMIERSKQESWVKNNPDFYDVLQHAETLAKRDPDLAESILEMPDTFERQKLVYKNIKALGLHKPEVKPSGIQEKVDANRRSPYYQPSGVGSAPYAQVGDFSNHGQKQAYDKMKQLQQQMRL